jgi:uncharacterized protein YndB with AHSA1/START domain
MSTKSVSATRTIAASPEAIFDLLADPSKHPLLDGSGSVKASRSTSPERLRLGAKFGMDMKIGAPYRITNTVIEFEENRRIAWQHVGKHVWRYALEPTDGGTSVTESWDWGPMGPFGKLVELAGFPKRNRESMVKTLDRIAELVEVE